MYEFTFEPTCTVRAIQAFTAGWMGDNYACSDSHELAAWFRGFGRYVRRARGETQAGLS